FGDLKKVESAVGTGPFMLERWEPNVKLVYVRNPNYFLAGLPYADGVDVLIDKDPSSRLAAWLGGKTDFGPEYQHAVRWLDVPVALRAQHGRGQAPPGRGRLPERVQDHGGGARDRVRARL